MSSLCALFSLLFLPGAGLCELGVRQRLKRLRRRRERGSNCVHGRLVLRGRYFGVPIAAALATPVVDALATPVVAALDASDSFSYAPAIASTIGPAHILALDIADSAADRVSFAGSSAGSDDISDSASNRFPNSGTGASAKFLSDNAAHE